MATAPPLHARIQRVLGEAVAGCLGGAGALMAYAVRAPSSSLLAPSEYRGCQTRKSIALTFDDGPSERTPEILSVLDGYRAQATFFQCGANIRRLPEIALAVRDGGHEIANHTDTHPNLCFHSMRSVAEEFGKAQLTIEETFGSKPALLRAPFGVRWFGFRETQRSLNLLGVMWTVLAKDWKLPASAIAKRILDGACNGAIICLHDGYQLERCRPTSPTAEALRIVIPRLLTAGYSFETVSSILCPKN